MRRTIYLTRNVCVGIALTIAAAVIVTFLVFFADRLYPTLVTISVIAFQLCFIWTCAEVLDGPDEVNQADNPIGRDFTH
jgi:hypothetical protein